MPRLPLAATLLFLGLHLPPAVAAGPVASSCVQGLGTSTAALETAAQQAFREQRFAAAYGRYARLADTGHAPSAERALFMLLNGQALFGSDWTATEKQQTCWNAMLVARARERVAVNGNPASD